jgi:hypothetical protein
MSPCRCSPALAKKPARPASPAELFHADTRQAAPNLSVTATSGGAAVVRIQANTLVDEPIVSVELRARCGSTSTRRYTLLADIAPIETLARSASAAPRLPQVGARSPYRPPWTVLRSPRMAPLAGPARRTNQHVQCPNPDYGPVLGAAKPAGVAHVPGSELVLPNQAKHLAAAAKRCSSWIRWMCFQTGLLHWTSHAV